VIEIDPGVSFGTGKHESTQLVIRQLQKYLKKGDQVLDVGCGSGILSIVALKLGAAHVVGTDIDADCIVSTVDNMQVNHLPKEAGEFYVGNLTDDEALQGQVGMECYDLVCANILADIIIPMAPALYRTLRAGGILITSGIIDFKEEAVAEALKVAGFRLAESNAQGEWRSITAEK
jgi:ribosomal protein L11 methyltransferase